MVFLLWANHSDNKYRYGKYTTCGAYVPLYSAQGATACSTNNINQNIFVEKSGSSSGYYNDCKLLILFVTPTTVKGKSSIALVENNSLLLPLSAPISRNSNLKRNLP